MIQTLERKVTGNVLPEPKIISAGELIDQLSQLCESRLHAVSAYPHAKGANEKLAAIHEIRSHLAGARKLKNDNEIVRLCLRLENKFLFIAPKTTWKLFETYWSRIDALMRCCREYLNWRKQQ